MRTRVLSLLLLLAMWQGAAFAYGSPTLMPGPVEVVAAAGAQVRLVSFWRHVSESLWRIALGLLIGVPIGIAAGALAALNATVRQMVGQLVSGVQVIPKVALLPILIAWMGIGQGPKISVIALSVFIPIVIAVESGLRYARPEVLCAGRSTGMTEWQILRYIQFPLALPGFFAGVRLSLGYAFLALSTAELVGASSGLGYLVYEAAYGMEIDVALVAVAALALLNWSMTAGLQTCERFTLAWHFVGESQ